ncbi:MAG: N-acetylmuramoyl-L-alanine amidase, partial [Candidatus Omnitrophota bacterium]
LHKISLRVGDNLVLVDERPVHLKDPVDIYQGRVVVPYQFKEGVTDVLFGKAYTTPKFSSSQAKIKKIVIDAGHGGKDPGTIGRSGVREKDINLDIAKRLSLLLKSEGYQVILTRSVDRFIPLSGRADIANNAKADLFISIHSNANRVRSINGFEAYYVSPKVSDSKRAYASAKNMALDLESSCFASSSLNLKAILWDMLYTSCRAESIELSHSICRAMENNLDS